MKINPILLEVFKNRFTSISEEMGVTLGRTAFSPNIKERKDFSCAIFDSKGDIVAQAAHIPVHLGSMPLSVKSAIKECKFDKGDMIALNNPYNGGTHLPDITIVAPVFIEESDEPVFYVANRAHHADVGGMTSGSMPLSTSLFQEGIIIPPIKIMEKGKIDEKIMKFFLSNIRTPEEREGDFAAQIMANHIGIRRIEELIDKYDFKTVNIYANELINYSEKVIRKKIDSIPNGTYEFEDYLDNDGIEDKKIKIHVKIEIKNDEAIIDFSNSDKQVQGSVNAVFSITFSAVLYVFRALVDIDIPTNAGCFKPLKVVTKKGSIVDATFPSAVAGGNVETSQRIVDVVLGALHKAIPDEIPAASQGTMNNVTIGGFDERTGKPFAYYETIAGGMGASPKNHGESAVHSHMTNTLNTPIEALEYSYPFFMTEYSIRKNSGGLGLYNGGNGVIREIKLLSDAEVTILSERRKYTPYGLKDGNNGKQGKNVKISGNNTIELPGKFNDRFKKGEILRIETPGGGGFGKFDNQGNLK
jgi:N-methylhydantoinase B